MRRSFPGGVLVVCLLVAATTTVLAVERAPTAVRPTSEEESFPMTYRSPYPPPSPLKFVGDHWTPYDPPDPATFPEDSQTHIIQSGDTLWVLSEQFYGDSLLWPFLWESNAYIVDPHWIYPGDPLQVPPLQIVPPMVEEEVVEVPIPGIEEAFIPAGSLSDMYCSFFVEPESWTKWDAILIGSDEPLKLSHATWDIMYMNKGRAEGIQGGEEYTVLRYYKALRHPETVEKMGEVVHTVGRARVLYVQEHTSTVAILDSCDEILPGFRLRPFEPLSPPLMERDPWFDPHALESTFETRGHVVYLDGDQEDVGTYDKVALDLGTDHGVIPGDHFLAFRAKLDDRLKLEREVLGGGIYRPRERWITRQLADEVFSNAFAARRGMRWVDRNRKRKEIRDLRTPPRYLAELVVLDTQPRTSTAIVVYSVKEVMLGDEVELKAGQTP